MTLCCHSSMLVTTCFKHFWMLLSHFCDEKGGTFLNRKGMKKGGPSNFILILILQHLLILICCTQGHMFLCYLLVLWYCLRIIYVVLICSFWSTIFLLTCPDWYSALNDLLALVCVFFPFTSYQVFLHHCLILLVLERTR